MKAILEELAKYNLWANTTLTDTVLALDESLHQHIVASSFPNLYATLLHMWDAESIWWQRMHKHESLIIPSKNFNPSVKEAVNGLITQSTLWANFVSGAQPQELQAVLEYRNLKKELFTQPLSEVLIHVFNHGTYHRGQLVTMMRALGVESIPQTDFIVWSRTLK
jgi:uncharacterized damage-inducible protein DinB